jgi:hypothetical protein
MDGGRLYGENAFLGAQAVNGLYGIALGREQPDILPPPDIIARAERYAELAGLEESAVLKRFVGVPELPVYAEIMYKLREYRAELREKLNRSKKLLTSAARIFKRIYPDAGYWRRNYLTENDYRTILSLAADTHPEYTLLLHMRNTGMLDNLLT